MTEYVRRNATPEHLALVQPPAALSIAELYYRLTAPSPDREAVAWPVSSIATIAWGE
jgi:hypothetical protein